MKKTYLLLSLLLCISGKSIGQKNIRDSIIPTSLISISYSYQFPGGDMAKQFLSNSAVGGGYFFKTKKNWFIGIDGTFMFRDSIKKNGILDSISTHDGFIISENGTFADVHLWERGFNIEVTAGKLFPVWGPNPNSGIMLLCGGGLLQHKIRIEDQDNDSPQIAGDYKKGYDRLTNGFSLSEFIGYMYLGNSRLVSFYAGFEFVQAWTQNRRTYNFDLMGPDNSNKFDLLYSFKFGWIIPFYKETSSKFYYY